MKTKTRLSNGHPFYPDQTVLPAFKHRYLTDFCKETIIKISMQENDWHERVAGLPRWYLCWCGTRVAHYTLCILEEPCPCLSMHTGTVCWRCWKWWGQSRNRTRRSTRMPSSSSQTFAWWRSPVKDKKGQHFRLFHHRKSKAKSGELPGWNPW